MPVSLSCPIVEWRLMHHMLKRKQFSVINPQPQRQKDIAVYRELSRHLSPDVTCCVVPWGKFICSWSRTNILFAYNIS